MMPALTALEKGEDYLVSSRTVIVQVAATTRSKSSVEGALHTLDPTLNHLTNLTWKLRQYKYQKEARQGIIQHPKLPERIYIIFLRYY
jgi:hypothetical protein